MLYMMTASGLSGYCVLLLSLLLFLLRACVLPLSLLTCLASCPSQINNHGLGEGTAVWLGFQAECTVEL